MWVGDSLDGRKSALVEQAWVVWWQGCQHVGCSEMLVVDMVVCGHLIRSVRSDLMVLPDGGLYFWIGLRLIASMGDFVVQGGLLSAGL